jgi:hypothetical protein
VVMAGPSLDHAPSALLLQFFCREVIREIKCNRRIDGHLNPFGTGGSLLESGQSRVCGKGRWDCSENTRVG